MVKLIGRTGDTVSLFADSKSDVTPSMEVEGLPAGTTITAGSNIITADGDVAFMKSTGQWNWIGGGE